MGHRLSAAMNVIHQSVRKYRQAFQSQKELLPIENRRTFSPSAGDIGFVEAPKFPGEEVWTTVNCDSTEGNHR